MIDYFHDTKKEVPLKYMTSQPPPYILNALFCKMKADYLRYVYECLSGDNGLLANNRKESDKVNLKKLINLRKKDEVRDDAQGSVDIVDSDIYYKMYSSQDKNMIELKSAEQKMENFYTQPLHLDEFLEHEVIFEYEKAMD